MAVKRAEKAEDLNKVMREARGDTTIVDTYHVPEHHKELNRMLLEASKSGTFETNQDGEVTHVEGEPVRSK